MVNGVGLHIIEGDGSLDCYGCRVAGCAPLDGWKSECASFKTYRELYAHLLEHLKIGDYVDPGVIKVVKAMSKTKYNDYRRQRLLAKWKKSQEA